MPAIAEVIQFKKRPDQVTARIEDGFVRVANDLITKICQTDLNGRESRILNAIIIKTYGFNKSMDWVSSQQLSELTGIAENHICTIKKGLIDRCILITEGRKTGVNPVISEWLEKSPIKQVKTKNIPKTGLKKTPENGTQTSRKRDSNLPKLGVISPENGIHKRQDNTTKDNTTKDKGVDLSACPEWLNQETLSDFIKHRAELKKPLTKTALPRLIKKLESFKASGINPNDCLEESITNGWQGVFPKTNKQQNQNQNRKAPNTFDKTDYSQGTEGFDHV